MITRIKDEGGSYKVTILSSEGVHTEQVTRDVGEAFALQAYAQKNGCFPPPPAAHEPEVVEAKGEKKK